MRRERKVGRPREQHRGQREEPSGLEVGKAFVRWRDQNNAVKVPDAEPVAQRPSTFFNPAPLESEEWEPALCPAHRASGLAARWVGVGVVRLAGPGRLGSAGRMRSVHISS